MASVEVEYYSETHGKWVPAYAVPKPSGRLEGMEQGSWLRCREGLYSGSTSVHSSVGTADVAIATVMG